MFRTKTSKVEAISITQDSCAASRTSKPDSYRRLFRYIRQMIQHKTLERKKISAETNIMKTFKLI